MTSRHLLIVEDDDAVRVFIARLILRAFPAFTSVRARDGATALVALALHPADLVITDRRMPGVSGLDLIRALRALPNAVPIIMLSGTLEDAGTTRAAGATRVFDKPVEVAVLRQAIRELLPP
jgi:CheY-like chemotaxis protein